MSASLKLILIIGENPRPELSSISRGRLYHRALK